MRLLQRLLTFKTPAVSEFHERSLRSPSVGPHHPDIFGAARRSRAGHPYAFAAPRGCASADAIVDGHESAVGVERDFDGLAQQLCIAKERANQIGGYIGQSLVMLARAKEHVSREERMAV